ncbi:hypothetical protein BpHYR1_006069, partial [Brachionus plicatilis]
MTIRFTEHIPLSIAKSVPMSSQCDHYNCYLNSNNSFTNGKLKSLNGKSCYMIFAELKRKINIDLIDHDSKLKFSPMMDELNER